MRCFRITGAKARRASFTAVPSVKTSIRRTITRPFILLHIAAAPYVLSVAPKSTVSVVVAPRKLPPRAGADSTYRGQCTVAMSRQSVAGAGSHGPPRCQRNRTSPSLAPCACSFARTPAARSRATCRTAPNRGIHGISAADMALIMIIAIGPAASRPHRLLRRTRLATAAPRRWSSAAARCHPRWCGRGGPARPAAASWSRGDRSRAHAARWRDRLAPGCWPWP